MYDVDRAKIRCNSEFNHALFTACFPTKRVLNFEHHLSQRSEYNCKLRHSNRFVHTDRHLSECFVYFRFYLALEFVLSLIRLIAKIMSAKYRTANNQTVCEAGDECKTNCPIIWFIFCMYVFGSRECCAIICAEETTAIMTRVYCGTTSNVKIIMFHTCKLKCGRLSWNRCF